jgi:hypothetical protein
MGVDENIGYTSYFNLKKCCGPNVVYVIKKHTRIHEKGFSQKQIMVKCSPHDEVKAGHGIESLAS